MVVIGDRKSDVAGSPSAFEGRGGSLYMYASRGVDMMIMCEQRMLMLDLGSDFNKLVSLDGSFRKGKHRLTISGAKYKVSCADDSDS